MLKINIFKTLFISSNIFYFFSIFFTYLDLNKFSIETTVYPTQFSLLTYLTIFFFLLNLFCLYFFISHDKLKIFNIFVYYLVLSSGVYILNFPLMDELILISSSIFFVFHLVKNKKFFYDKHSELLLLLLIILLFQSITGFLHDERSVRYFFIFLALIITFFYFSNLQEVDKKNQVTFINFIFYAILIYMIYQIFFWFLKYYIFEMKFVEQKFIGDMQPSYAKSSSGHFDAIHILSGYLILYFSLVQKYFFKSIILVSLILSSWILADARSSLFIVCLVVLFYFLQLKLYKKFIFILCSLLILMQSSFFENDVNKYLNRVKNITFDLLDFKQGTEIKQPTYKLEDGSYFYEKKERSAYPDFGRLSYALGAVYSLEYNFEKIFFGCGFYGFYYCANRAINDFYQKYNVPYEEKNRGFGNKKVRPPAFGTIIIENGLISIFLVIIFYFRYLKKNISFQNMKIKYNSTIMLSTYFAIMLISWSFFSNMLDIVYIYLFFINIFRKYLLYKY